MQDILDLDIAHLGSMYRMREASPVEVVTSALDRIAALDGKLRSFITVTAEAATMAARRAEREIAEGVDRGPLHGVPLTLKDVIDTAGVRTTSGSRIFADHVPAQDAEVVSRLTKAGAIILGKNNMHELAMGSTSANPYFGVCRNPWHLDHVPGGSSGGSAAAVAARLSFGSIATDTAGSIRSPASQCGVVGLKPTIGRVSRQGIFPVSETLDHVGAIARTALDVALLLDALIDGPSLHPAEVNADLRGLTIGIPTDYFFDAVSHDVEERVRGAVAVLAEMGASVVPMAWPQAREAAEATLTISAYEAARLHRDRLEARPRDYSSDIRERLQSGLRISESDYDHARASLVALRQHAKAAMLAVDLFAAPSNPVVAPRHGESSVRIRGADLPIGVAMPRFGAPQNATGYPAISVPCGLTPEGLPVGIQLVSRPLQEALLIRVAAAYQSATAWHSQRPAAVASLPQ